jgi:hypothetical protein
VGGKTSALDRGGRWPNAERGGDTLGEENVVPRSSKSVLSSRGENCAIVYDTY